MKHPSIPAATFDLERGRLVRRQANFASAAAQLKAEWEPFGYRVHVNPNERRIVIYDAKDKP